MKKSLKKPVKMAKKVLKHLKEDTSEFKEQIADDKKLAKTVRKGMKKAKGKC